MAIPLKLERDDSITSPLLGVGRRIVVATHRRSGTHLAIDLLRRHFAACQARKRRGEGLDSLYLNLDRLDARRRPIDEARAESLLRRAERPIVKTHELLRHVKGCGDHAEFTAAVLEDADLYCVHRDGRDVLCSLFVYTRSHDRDVPATLSEFLRQCFQDRSRVRHWAKDVRASLALPGVRAIGYASLMADPKGAVARFAGDLGLAPLAKTRALPHPVRSRWGSRWRRLFATHPEGTSIPGRSWGRASPSWRRAFSARDRRFFHDEAGDLLIELGYEDSDDWVEKDAG
jgi:hypothetical protein